jgi:peptidylprolyl isomerase
MKYFIIFTIVFFISLVSCKQDAKNTATEKTEDVLLVQPIPNKKKNIVKTNKDSLNANNAVAFFKEYGKQNKETKVKFSTRLGDIIIQLYNNTPIHRANFIFLTKKGYFNTTCFHRVVPNFIAQGGNSENRSTSDFRNKYKNYRLPPEFRKNLRHNRGVIAIARDWEYNPEKLSTPFEFYITVNKRGEHHLNGEHTVFGKIIKGMNVVDKITKLKSGEDDWPYKDVFIKAEVLSN